MVELIEITENNFEECISLNLTQEQWKYIANNSYSLSEAFAINNEGIFTAKPYAVYTETTMVGFIMAVYQPINENDPDDNENIFYLPRMMIDKRYQGNGYGKNAMIKMIDYLRTFPYGSADAIILSCSKENVIAYQMYESLGFVDTGEFDEDGDTYCRLELL